MINERVKVGSRIINRIHLNLFVGGLFDNKNAEDAETVFRYAVEIANTEMLGTSGNRLEAGWARVPEGDVAAVSKRACKMLKVS